MKQTLLLADNDDGFRETLGRVLAAAGYEVKLAANPQQARSVLREAEVDIAILDVRLENDDDLGDISGLEVATDLGFRHVPKIILTGFPTPYENLRRVIGPSVDELPSAAAFVDKAEGPKKLLDVISQTFATWPRLRMTTIKVSEQTKADYEVARQQAKLSYGVAFTVSIFGFLVIIAGIFLAWGSKLAIGIVATASGLIMEALSYLFFKRLDLVGQ
jgi:DNA-binding NtrC family response regulator